MRPETTFTITSENTVGKNYISKLDVRPARLLRGTDSLLVAQLEDEEGVPFARLTIMDLGDPGPLGDRISAVLEADPKNHAERLSIVHWDALSCVRHEDDFISKICPGINLIVDESRLNGVVIANEEQKELIEATKRLDVRSSGFPYLCFFHEEEMFGYPDTHGFTREDVVSYYTEKTREALKLLGTELNISGGVDAP